MKKNNGFTLIELLVVMGIIAVIATIVLVAINPARQFAQSRNTQRSSNVNAILNAIGQRIADNKGVFEGGSCPILSAATTSVVDLTTCLVPTYLTAMPIDPKPNSGDYGVSTTTAGRINVGAPSSELGETIYITR